jgi:hypothetical protein
MFTSNSQFVVKIVYCPHITSSSSMHMIYIGNTFNTIYLRYFQNPGLALFVIFVPE